jgi:hypothetical protein
VNFIRRCSYEDLLEEPEGGGASRRSGDRTPDGSVRGGLANATAVASVRYQAHPPNGLFLVFLGRCLRVANFLELRKAEVHAGVKVCIAPPR